ncbi:hypothetical protein K4K61_002878 [Colletotrichum sp. SAR11_59]|nr:hypothetical protein K4K61_002878 [Colletotrichum sp. SAR11_59]
MDPASDSPTEVDPDVAPNSVEKPTTEPATEPTPDIATDDATDLAQVMAEIVMEPNADVKSQQASQSTPESTSQASAKSPSAAEKPLPPSPRPLPGFRYSSILPRLLVPIERSIASDLRTSFGDGTPPATEAPAVVTKDSTAALSDASDDDTASFHTAPLHPRGDDLLDPKLTTFYEIKKFRNRDFSKQQRRIIDALDLTLRPGGREAASEVAAEIDRLCPPKEEEDGVEDWLWMLWETVIDIVEERLWTDLPMFSYCMEAYFNDPTTGDTESSCEDKNVWVQLNWFAAKCLQGGFGGPYHHAIHAMRSALEEEMSPDSFTIQYWD